MPKRDRPRRRRAKEAPPESQQLVARLLDTPGLAQVVPLLQPELLHRVIQACGLEDCHEIVALATPDQLRAVFDLDLWRGSQPGLDEQFDAERFGVWLAVLLEGGASFAARKVTEIDAPLVIAGLAQHVRVFDPGTFLPTVSSDDEAGVVRRMGEELNCKIGGYLIVGRRDDAWEAITEVLAALETEDGEYFHRVMHGCRRLSNSGREIDGLDNLLSERDQVLLDLGIDREERRERKGYLTPAQARAFLESARTLRLDHATEPPKNPLAVAYFRALEWPAATDDGIPDQSAAAAAPGAPDDSAAGVAAIVGILVESGVLPGPPKALLDGAHGHPPRLASIHRLMESLQERDGAAFLSRNGELAYLANAVVAGGSVQARPFSAQEGYDAAVATCNLGLENWPAQWLPVQPLPDDFLAGHDLVSVFQVGWMILYRDVCMFASERLVEILRAFRCPDRDLRLALRDLRVAMLKQRTAGAPWRAADALDVLISLDMPTWAVLLALIAECPVIHAALGASSPGTRAVNATAFEFISENSQIASVREFMASVPERLQAG